MEEGQGDDNQCSFEIKRKFNITLKYKVWKTFKTKTDKRGDRHLTGDWTNIIAKEVSAVNPACPIVFKSNHLSRVNSRKQNSPYFTAKARCAFSGCLRYTFKLKKEPVKGERVKVKVKVDKPFTHIHHEDGVTKGRQFTGNVRRDLAAGIKEKGPSNVFYERFSSVDEVALEAGNSSAYGSKDVMRKILSENNLNCRLHSDVIAEVSLLKRVYEMEDESRGLLKGCIQSISTIPFSVSLYSNEQLSLLAENISTVPLHFDGTGKVISNIPSQPKRVFYYPLVLKGQEPGDPPVPVAEFISNSHNTVDISTFFLRLNRDLRNSYPSVGVPQRIEVDYSWAFIHAILLSFNREDIALYLQRAWDTIHSTREWGSKTKLHICSAHLLHKIASRLSKMVSNKEARRYIMYVVARIVDADDLNDIDEAFKNLCILLLSKHVDSHPDLPKCVSYLNKVVAKEDPEDEIHEDDNDEDEEEASTGFKPSESVFATHFKRTINEVKSYIGDGDDQSTVEQDVNKYYSPDVVTYLLNTYMCILPLWTGIMLDGGVTHDTNSCVENWMKILKSDILRRKTRLTPSNFIINVRSNLKGRIREYKTKCCRTKTKKPKQRGLSKNSFSKSEEKWGGKKAKKGVYFSSPSKLSTPTPATLSSSRKKILKRKRESNALHWGGRAEFGGRLIHLSNTCPVDNLLMVMYFLMQREDIRTWFERNKNHLKVCQVLLDVCSLFGSGNWTEGRILWMHSYLAAPQGNTWDTWGSEAEMFVKHFDVQETETDASCSKRKCPRKKRHFSSVEILLG